MKQSLFFFFFSSFLFFSFFVQNRYTFRRLEGFLINLTRSLLATCPGVAKRARRALAGPALPLPSGAPTLRTSEERPSLQRWARAPVRRAMPRRGEPARIPARERGELGRPRLASLIGVPGWHPRLASPVGIPGRRPAANRSTLAGRGFCKAVGGRWWCAQWRI